MKKIQSTLLSMAVAAVAVFGMAACNDNSEPGDTTVDQGEFYEDQGGMVVEDDEDMQTRQGDTTQEAGERYYEKNKDKAIGDGAYDGKGDGVERDEVDGQ